MPVIALFEAENAVQAIEAALKSRLCPAAVCIQEKNKQDSAIAYLAQN